MKIYFIGIGGIGVSALARYYLSQGAEVFGSDLVMSDTILELQAEGAKITIGQNKRNALLQNLPIDMVVYSAAVPHDNPELCQAEKLHIKTLTYAQSLAEISKNYFTVCVAGTHGKSTTTAMLSLVLLTSGFNPTVFIGTKLKEFGGKNFHLGDKKPFLETKKPLLVIEADEWNSSFLSYAPNAAIITNIDKDHLDYYKNYQDIIEVFQKFILRIVAGGIVVVNQDDTGVRKIRSWLKKLHHLKAIFYSCRNSDAQQIKKILQVPGEHNVSNALSVFKLSRELGIKEKSILEGLGHYKGAWRRFETIHIPVNTREGNFSAQQRKETANHITIIHDYAHHPSEVKATLQAARQQFKNKKIYVVFQPHQIARTKALFSSFKKAFYDANGLVLLNVYEVAGREKPHSLLEKESLSRKLTQSIQDSLPQKGVLTKTTVCYAKNKSQIKKYFSNHLCPGDVVIFMGAGDIYEIAKKLLKDLPAWAAASRCQKDN